MVHLAGGMKSAPAAAHGPFFVVMLKTAAMLAKEAFLPATYVWLILIFVITIGSLYAFWLSSKAKEESDDTGSAILAFGRAFPGEAIRDAVATADGQAVFLRLHENNVGCVQFHKETMSCQLLKAGNVSIRPGEARNGVHIDFLNSARPSREFVFRNARQAAEVSLWLLGSLAAMVPAEQPSDDSSV